MDTQKLTRPINVDKRAVIKTDHEAYFQEASFIKGQLKSKTVRGSLKETTISTLICPWTLSLKSLYSSSMSNDGMSVAKDQSEATGAQVGLVLANLGGASLYFTMWCGWVSGITSIFRY